MPPVPGPFVCCWPLTRKSATDCPGRRGFNGFRKTYRAVRRRLYANAGTQGEAVTERKGVLKGEVEIRGKSVHAGMFYEQGASAIREAAYQILQLEESSNSNAITYNCGIIEGGEAENRVPDYCRFRVDVRFRTQEEQIKALEHLQQTVDHCRVPGTNAAWRQLSFRPPMLPSREGRALFEAASTNGAALWLGKSKRVRKRRRIRCRLYGGSRDSLDLWNGRDRL